MQTPVKCLILDLDDTLIPSTEIYAKALHSIGIKANSSEFLEARRRVKSRLGAGHVSARNRLLYIKEWLEMSGSYSPQENLFLMNDYEVALESLVQESWEALERDALMEELSHRFRMVVVTNENLRTQLIKMRAIDPEGTFFSLITSEEVGREKPEPKLFHEALRKFKEPPSSCVMIGDSWENDIIPAKNLGMKAIHSIEFATFSEAPELLPNTNRVQRLSDIGAVLSG